MLTIFCPFSSVVVTLSASFSYICINEYFYSLFFSLVLSFIRSSFGVSWIWFFSVQVLEDLPISWPGCLLLVHINSVFKFLVDSYLGACSNLVALLKASCFSLLLNFSFAVSLYARSMACFTLSPGKLAWKYWVMQCEGLVVWRFLFYLFYFSLQV